ncbi:MBL fold metallo-hydrolase [Haloplanus rubicundus]|uniref:MBL fold metallo-hydrolase n=1 Tax=Haloplanus rubicundus TaxID=1547898 RepID=A0A345E3X6_9EURY|nr:lamin tail domain-containing protein [Haloplanus rubicundus]AXG06898.1 MBL fold metallo-hydrolase [Haloplanus rubicundus]
MSRTARTVLVALALLLVVALAGCGGAVGPTDTSAPAATETGTGTGTETGADGIVEVHFINVGQSVSTLVVGPTGETMLVDTGHYNDDGAYVLTYLERRGIDRIDHLVVSHNDADHIGGNAAIIDYYEREAAGIGAVYDPGIAASTQTYGRYLDAVEEHGVTLYETREGDEIRFESVDVAVLGPPDPYLEGGARNENSIVLKLTHGETSVLLTGDAEDDQEAYLVDRYGDRLRATVLKAGHHGSSSSSSGAFLDAVRPNAVVVSSAYDSRYGHPTEAVLERFADRSLPTYWTATHGDIVLVSDGRGVTVRTQAAAPTDPLDLRDADDVEPGNQSVLADRARFEGGEGTVLTAAPTVTDGGTPTGRLVVAEINPDPDGPDREHLDDEYVVFENADDEPLDLSGWTVEDEAGRTYTFPDGYVLAAGGTVTLRTGTGTDTDAELYWGLGSAIWNNDGDTVIVHNSDGDPVLRETYP